MKIRVAEARDIDRILCLLSQVLEIHARIRPDIFIPGTTKYTREELLEKLSRRNETIFVATDDNDVVQGYAFCVLRDLAGSRNLCPHKILFVDDLCVDEKARGQKIGQALFLHVKEEARLLGCYEVTLNVWEGNDARSFYDKMGMKPKETQMEIIL